LKLQKLARRRPGPEDLDLLHLSQWDLLLLDIHMSGRNGIDILREAIRRYPESRVLVMSALSEAQYARVVIWEGAKGYLCKTGDLAELLKGLRVVLAGRRYVRSRLAEMMASDLKSRLDPHRPLHDRLSARERRQVLPPTRGGQRCFGNRARTHLERQDDKYLPNSDSGENELNRMPK
jgi:two-component system, NarL family, invasion response regulator UvrY